MDQEMNRDMDLQAPQGEGNEAASYNEAAPQGGENEAASQGQDASEPMDMEAALELYDKQYDSSRLHKGHIRSGTIVGETDSGDGWLVNVGYKCEGVLPRKEWTHRVLVEETEMPKVGDEVEVQVTNIRDGEDSQVLLLSRWRHEFDRRWDDFENLLAQSDTFQVKGLRKVKGGIMAECCGLEGFIPNSQLSESGRGVNLANFIGQVFDVKLLEKDHRKHRLVFTRKPLIEKEAAEIRAKFYSEVHENDIVEGEVSSLTDFGVFVTIGAMDGLVHMTEVSWKRNPRIRDLYKKGDKVTVKVIGLDREKDRISLSIKQVQGDPWLTVGERVFKDEVRKGVVTNVTEFGAFVELEPGIEGLVHIGDISWGRMQDPKKTFRKGQEIEVVVLEVNTERNRISLGYKQLNDPWRDIDKRFSVGQDITVKVVRLADFGAFVEVEPGVEGLIHISQLSSKRVEKPDEVLHKDQEVLARVIEVNPEQRRMRLSLSALEEPARPKREDQPKRQAESREDRRAARESAAMDDGALQYNPFAEAFRGQDSN